MLGVCCKLCMVVEHQAISESLWKEISTMVYVNWMIVEHKAIGENTRIEI